MMMLLSRRLLLLLGEGGGGEVLLHGFKWFECSRAWEVGWYARSMDGGLMNECMDGRIVSAVHAW